MPRKGRERVDAASDKAQGNNVQSNDVQGSKVSDNSLDGSLDYALDYDERGNRERVDALRRRGVTVWSAERVFVGREVAAEAIEPGAVLANAVIRGKTTCIGRGTRVGVLGSAAITEAQIGRDVELGAGSYTGCVLCDGAKVRGFAELRAGTVLEEGAEAAHTVGLKNTFFGAYAVAGSCINFCDAYVSGGTSRADHTEIGSGAMHFNFSPRRDKFGSLLGGSRALLGRQPAIFVGGNTGLVAPLVVPFGALIPAGATVRTWPPEEGERLAPAEAHHRKLAAAVALLGALEATIAWYTEVRGLGGDALEQAVVRGAVRQLTAHRDWRSAELRRYVDRVRGRFAVATDEAAGSVSERLAAARGREAAPECLREEYSRLRAEHTHREALAKLSAASVSAGEAWLGEIEQRVVWDG